MSIPQSKPLVPRIQIPLTATSPAGLYEAEIVDPWSKSGKYALYWTYFSLAILVLVLIVRLWHFWQDRIRRALYKQEFKRHSVHLYQHGFDGQQAILSGEVGNVFLREQMEAAEAETRFKPVAHGTGVSWTHDLLALFRWGFYRPVPDITWRGYTMSFSSLSVIFCGFLALLFVVLVVFLQQPLYWESIRFGSPPVAIRAGMLAIAITPWVIATSMKANILTVLTGIGPERLNVFHRWMGYLTLILSLIHMIPFYVQPVWDDGGMEVYSKLFPGGSGIIYGTGIACMAPLIWLCVASLPVIRRVAYEVFVMLHAPVAAIYVGMLFWHTKNYLRSWDYLYTSIAIWAFCYLLRLFNLNWLKPWWDLSFLTGDEAAVTLLPEGAVKITIPTRMRWKPGQFVYLRMPGIGIFDNHPFTIASMCSSDFPSAYGEDYRDCVVVFKPYRGFTRRVMESAIEKGPFHTYRAFLDGPYGGLRRDLSSFDTVVLIAGGSGITALMSQLLNLIKRMRDGKAITKKIVVVWAIKRLEAMDWFREELRICRESAPVDSVTCKFFVTGAKQREQILVPGQQPPAAVPLTPGLSLSTAPRVPAVAGARALTHQLHDKLDGFVSGIASKRNSALIMAEAQGDETKERELREENEDRITALPPQQILAQHGSPYLGGVNSPDSYEPDHKSAVFESNETPAIARQSSFHFPPIQRPAPHFNHIPPQGLKLDTNVPLRPPELAHLRATNSPTGPGPDIESNPTSGSPTAAPVFDFGFPATPTSFQKSLVRFAFPVPHQIDGGWTVEYGRPDLGYMLKEWSRGGANGRGILGRRTAVFVCGPARMREGVARTVAGLQGMIWGDDMLDEIFLHTENYAL